MVAASPAENASESGHDGSVRVDGGYFCVEGFLPDPAVFRYLALALGLTSESQQLLVLPGHEVDRSVFEQSREDEEEAHGHPDVYGLHIRDLNTQSL